MLMCPGLRKPSITKRREKATKNLNQPMVNGSIIPVATLSAIGRKPHKKAVVKANKIPFDRFDSVFINHIRFRAKVVLSVLLSGQIHA